MWMNNCNEINWVECLVDFIKKVDLCKKKVGNCKEPSITWWQRETRSSPLPWLLSLSLLGVISLARESGQVSDPERSIPSSSTITSPTTSSLLYRSKESTTKCRVRIWWRGKVLLQIHFKDYSRLVNCVSVVTLQLVSQILQLLRWVNFKLIFTKFLSQWGACQAHTAAKYLPAD